MALAVANRAHESTYQELPQHSWSDLVGPFDSIHRGIIKAMLGVDVRIGGV